MTFRSKETVRLESFWVANRPILLQPETLAVGNILQDTCVGPEWSECKPDITAHRTGKNNGRLHNVCSDDLPPPVCCILAVRLTFFEH
jgi:hypothetical protein